MKVQPTLHRLRLIRAFLSIRISFVFALLFIGTGGIASPTPAQACTCPSKAELEEALEKSSLVFVGSVKDKRVNPLKAEESEVRFTVTRKLKGFEEVPTSTVLVYTPIDPEYCGYNFSPGMEYLVFATGTPAHFRTDTCSRTDIIDKVLVDIHKLIRLTGSEGK